MENTLDFYLIDGHKLHLFRSGKVGKPPLLFMSGSGTVAPMYDFKILYEKLLDDFRIIVIEKFGYGYSDLYQGKDDIDSVISFQREALEKAGEKGPFILIPHSMSGLEAIRWKQKYPDEVKAIIGLDMASPKTYLEWGQEGLEKRIALMKKLQKAKNKGFLFWYPQNKRGLNKDEIKEQKLLWRRNAFNDCYIKAAQAVLKNAVAVDEGGNIDGPILLFVSNGKEVSANWLKHESDFAEATGAEIIYLTCGHYVHYYESELISKKIKDFLGSI